MDAESAKKFEALEQLAADLRRTFTGAGYEPVAPAILQPADIFLDGLGEAVRSRTYVFHDLDGHELCLRPDLTVPAARIYLERHEKVYDQSRYCYNGPVFRYASVEDKSQPREFRQSGLELYAFGDTELAETEVLKLTIDGIEAAGVHELDLKIGDLGLFHALLDAIDMPERWRQRLKHHFWRPVTFHKLLDQLSMGEEGVLATRGKWPRLDPDKPQEAEEKLAAFLTERNIPVIGARSLSEVTTRLLELEADLREEPLPKDAVQLISDYLGIKAPPRAAVARIADLADTANINIKPLLKKFERRLELFRDKGIPLKRIEFNAEFGRSFEYYTGFVFQASSTQMPELGPLCGGGRYDHLLRDLGASKPVPAVGCAIQTELLLAAREGELS